MSTRSRHIWLQCAIVCILICVIVPTIWAADDNDRRTRFLYPIRNPRELPQWACLLLSLQKGDRFDGQIVGFGFRLGPRYILAHIKSYRTIELDLKNSTDEHKRGVVMLRPPIFFESNTSMPDPYVLIYRLTFKSNLVILKMLDSDPSLKRSEPVYDNTWDLNNYGLVHHGSTPLTKPCFLLGWNYLHKEECKKSYFRAYYTGLEVDSCDEEMCMFKRPSLVSCGPKSLLGSPVVCGGTQGVNRVHYMVTGYDEDCKKFAAVKIHNLTDSMYNYVKFDVARRRRGAKKT